MDGGGIREGEDGERRKEIEKDALKISQVFDLPFFNRTSVEPVDDTILLGEAFLSLGKVTHRRREGSA